MIEIDNNGIVRMTNEGFDAYNCQLFHGIAANLYAADRSNYLAKVAIIAASVLAVISIICTNSRGDSPEVNPESWTQLKGSNETEF